MSYPAWLDLLGFLCRCALGPLSCSVLYGWDDDPPIWERCP